MTPIEIQLTILHHLATVLQGFWTFFCVRNWNPSVWN